MFLNQLTFLGTDQTQYLHQPLIFLTYLKGLHHHPVVVHMCLSMVILRKRKKYDLIAISCVQGFPANNRTTMLNIGPILKSALDFLGQRSIFSTTT